MASFQIQTYAFSNATADDYEIGYINYVILDER